MNTEHFHIASGSGGKRPWRIIYHPDPNDWRVHYELTGVTGVVVHYKRPETAAAQARAWNAAGCAVRKRPDLPGYEVCRLGAFHKIT
jgi:hypothetical protein